MRVPRCTAVLSLLTVAALGLTACSSDAPSDAAPSSATAPEAAAPAAPEGPVLLTVDDFVQRTSAASDGVSSVHMTMVMQAAGETMNADADVVTRGDAADMRMTMTIPEVGAVEMIVVDGAAYMTLGDLTGGQYLDLTSDAEDNPFAGMTDELTGSFDAKSTAKLAGAVRSVEPAGDPVEIDGVLTQPYEVVVDGAAAAAMLGDEADAAQIPETVTYTYWIGEDDLMRRLVADMPEGSVEMVFSAWGADVTITAPTPDQIMDSAALGF